MSQPVLSSARAFTPSPAVLSPAKLFISTPSTSTPSTPAVLDPVPTHEPVYETVRHMVCGSLAAVRMTILILHKKHHYAEPNDWSRPMPTGRPNEVMVVLTKKVRVR